MLRENVHRVIAKMIVVILKRFWKNRDIETLVEKDKALPRETKGRNKGKITTKTGDYGGIDTIGRHGHTQSPILTTPALDPTQVIPVTHLWLHMFAYLKELCILMRTRLHMKPSMSEFCGFLQSANLASTLNHI